jgi:hypothetical protein
MGFSMRITMGERTYLKVPFEEKDLAKQLGASWDKDKKQWFFVPGTDLAKIHRWLPEKVQYETKYVERNTDFDLPDAIAFAVAKEGLNASSFKKIADFYDQACLNGAMGPDYRTHCILGACHTIFPEIAAGEIYMLIERWEGFPASL